MKLFIYCYVLTMVLISGKRGSMIARKLHGIENKLFKNKLVQETPVAFSNGRSKVECGIACSNETFCLSFFYKNVTKECRRFQRDFMDLENTVDENNWVYFHVFKDVPSSGAFCPTSDGFKYNNVIGICFKYYDREESYDDAVLNCKADKGRLIHIDRHLKQAIVSQYLDTIDMDPNNQIRIGGYANGPKWYFEENVPLTYYSWNTDADQPEGQNGIALNKKFNYQWHDVSDERKLTFICEIPHEE